MHRLKLIRNHLSSSKTISSFKSDQIKIEHHDDKIKIVRMINFSKLNAINENLLDDLYDALLLLDRDDMTKVIIITGNEKVFCAGVDISRLAKDGYPEMIKHDFLQKIEKISYDIGKPMIAAVSGFCFGGGFELALSCDIIGSTKASKFGFPEIKIGLFPGAGGTQKLSKVCGYYKASEVVLSGDVYNAETFNRLNIVNYIHPDYETLMKNTLILAEKISNYSFLAIKTAKKSLKASLETTLRQGLDSERNIFYGLFSTEDKKIGTEAFLNKKKPIFIDK